MRKLLNKHFILTNVVINRYTKITEVNLSAFAYRLFYEDFSSILGAKCETFVKAK